MSRGVLCLAFFVLFVALWFARSHLQGFLRSPGDAAGVNGILLTREPEFTLRLRSVSGLRVVEGRGGRAAVAAGQYWLEDWSARMPDGRGHRWEVRRAAGEPARELQVRPGGVARLPLAVPVTAELVIGQGGQDVSFRLRLKGAGQETLGEVREDGRRWPPPGLRIEDARGRTLARLRGEDTCGAGCALTWRAPRDLVQPLRAIPEASLGPFQGAAVAFRFRLNDRPSPPATLDSLPH